jgi:hypothetical protein
LLTAGISHAGGVPASPSRHRALRRRKLTEERWVLDVCSGGVEG